MRELTLTRFAYSTMGVFGTIMVGELQLFTVENPWKNNEPFKSCIPTGTYKCEDKEYWRGGYAAIEVTDVPDRSNILFHKGNTKKDVQGCIAPGLKLGAIQGLWAVTGSRAAFLYLMDWFAGDPFLLHVVNLHPSNKQQVTVTEPMDPDLLLGAALAYVATAEAGALPMNRRQFMKWGLR